MLARAVIFRDACPTLAWCLTSGAVAAMQLASFFHDREGTQDKSLRIGRKLLKMRR
jgi:hypothetical protein